VVAPAGDSAVHEHERQAVGAVLVEVGLYCCVRGEGGGGVSEVAALDGDAVRPPPVQIGGEPDELRVNFRTANTGGRADRRVEGLECARDRGATG
jgi:hypothetical protein